VRLPAHGGFMGQSTGGEYAGKRAGQASPALWVRRNWQFLLGVIVSVFFIWLAVRKLDLRAVAYYLEQANYWWLLPGVLVYFAAVWARTWRWHYLLRPIKSISLDKLFPVVCIGYFGNNVYPLRAGEVIRAFVLRRNEGVAVSSSLSTTIVERVFDGLVMLLFVFFALPFVGGNGIPAAYRPFVILFSLLFFGALIVFFWMVIDRERVTRIYRAIAARLIPLRYRNPLDDVVQRFMDGLSALSRPRDVMMIFWTSIVIWLLETVKYWFVLHAFGLQYQVGFVGLMLMNGVVNLATTLPSAPGYIGTFEIGTNVLIALGVEANRAFGYTIVLHAALWLPITVLGGYYMWREGVKWRDFEAAQSAKRESSATTSLPQEDLAK
jgi:glycosyltransferase 2 family protein